MARYIWHVLLKKNRNYFSKNRIESISIEYDNLIFILFYLQSVNFKDTQGKVTKAAEKAQKKK